MNREMNVNFTHLGVDVFTETLTIPTYRLGEPDPNPPLFAKGVRNVYPYSRRDSFTEEIEDRAYDAVKLVSPWIEATILPDWGFHLYRAVDRLTGRDLFHAPLVMKPANNAIRGAYVAGGVEMNFPVGHNAMTYDRVGLYLKKTQEGVSALFHHVDRCSGMSLAAGVTVSREFRGVMFDQYLHNQTALPRPWYYWLNAGVAPDESLRFMFPNERMIGHFEGPYLGTKKEYAYPLHDGRDYSKNMEIPEPIGLFSFGNVNGWFGAWYDAWDFGVVRWAPTWRAGGQKFWSWGNSEEGMSWGPIAADQELPVPEIQSGRPEVQMDRGIMPPYSATSHREWWMPVSAIGDVTTASRFGAVHLVDRGESSLLKISAAREVTGCKVVVNDSEVPGVLEMIVGEIAEVPLDRPKSEITRLEIRNSQGTLMSWNAGRPFEPANITTLLDDPKPVSEMSAEALFSRGFEWQRILQPSHALEFYRKCLMIDPGHSGARLQIGLMHLMNDKLDDALREFKGALKSDRTNDEALYLHGLASWCNGDEEQARADFAHTAATGREYAAPAMVRLAIAACRRRDFIEMDLLIADGLTTAPGTPLLIILKAIRAREKNLADDFQAACEQIEKQLGVCSWLENEKRLIDEARTLYLPAADETEDGLRLAAARHYLELRFLRDARALLESCESEPGRAEAAYLSRLLGEKIEGFRPTSFFAHGREIKNALRQAIETDQRDAAARFSLGLLLTNEDALEEAVSLFYEATELENNNALYWTTLARVLGRLGKDEQSIECLEQAIEASVHNPLTWVELDRALGRLGRRDASWLARFNSAPDGVLRNDDARMALAKLNGDSGRYDAAERLLSEHVFHPYELSHDLRNLRSEILRDNAVELALAGRFEDAKIAIGKALEYPANLQLGKPLRCFDALTLYLAALIYESAGDPSGAKAFYQRSAHEFQPDPTPSRAWSILSKIKHGEDQTARAELDQLAGEANVYLQAEFQPDLNGELREVLDLCDRIRSGWTPSLNEFGKGTTEA